jgi:hypothetical protein
VLEQLTAIKNRVYPSRALRAAIVAQEQEAADRNPPQSTVRRESGLAQKKYQLNQ